LEGLVESGPAQMLLWAVNVHSAEDQTIVVPLAEEFLSVVESYATSIDINLNWYYLNYAYKTENPISYYGADAIGKLQAASAKYDPDAVFQNLRRTGFKIPT
jgi:hypothetical protein